LKIAVYSHYFVPEIGAPSARIFDMASNWVTSGDSVEVVTCFPNHPTGQIYEGYRSSRYASEDLKGIKVHRHWTYITPNKGFIKKTLGHLSYVPSAMLTSSRRLQSPEVFIGSSPTLFAAQAAVFAARRYDAPFVMEIRDLWPAIFVELGVLRNRNFIRLLERWEMALYRYAARIVTVTEKFREDLIRRGISANKVATITNGADTDFWSADSARPGLREELGLAGKHVALYIGAHGISQGLRAILQAADRLKARRDIAFVFVGEGAEKESLVAEAKRRGLENVIFLNPVDKSKVRDFYALADLCLVPLRDIPGFDAFIPSKMFEMMAMSCPIVGSVRGEAAGILRRSGGAELVRPEDSEGIAAAVVRVVDNPELRNKMGIAGRAFVERHYTRKVLAERYREVLAEAISERAH
jgi:glycosyltransferase involved in cell wall biosynthesis